MKFTAKRFLSLLVAAAMVFSMLPVGAHAHTEQDADAAHDRVRLPDVTTELYINPLYEGTVEESERSAEHFTPIRTAGLSVLSDYGEVSDAAEVLRESMVAHRGEVVVHFRSTSSDYNALFREVFHEAMEHTGEPLEGDYLVWQYLSCRGSISRNRSGSYYYYDMTFYLGYYTSLAQEARVTAAVESLLDELDLYEAADYYKVKGIYDWICANITYDYENLYDPNYTLKHTAYAAIIDRTAVCQGYAVLLYRMALTLGVDCRVIAGGNHGWNIVKLGDLYYYVDSTWDAGQAPHYDYFLQNEDGFRDHTREDYSMYYGEGCNYISAAFYAEYPMSPRDFSLNNHTHAYSSEEVAPTCTEPGYTTYFCTICGTHREDSFVDPLGHDWEEGDCENPSVCRRCGETDGEATGHDWVSADCENPGVCSRCGAVQGEALGHDWADADCETPRTCSRCGETEGEALGHDWMNATCENPRTCDRCGETQGQALGHHWLDADCENPRTCDRCEATRGEPLGHAWVEADCETPRTCSRCGETDGEATGHDWAEADCETPRTCRLCEETEGEALGHDWADATCETPKTCSRCEETEGEALGHDWADADCEHPKTCSRCEETEGEALGHAWVDGDCETPRTCSRCEATDGEAPGHDWTEADCETAAVCRRCGETQGEALGHDWAAADCEHPATCRRCGETDGEAQGHSWTDATCEEPATCRRCGETQGEALGHDWADADCEHPKTCTRCGETEGEALGHDWADAGCDTPRTCRRCEETEGEALGHDWVDADCENPATCRRCGETEGEPLGHDWVDADCEHPRTCRRCEETEGEALGHDWADADCETPKTCRRCEVTDGEALGHDWESEDCDEPATCRRCGTATEGALGHDWVDADCETPKTCRRCEETEGEALGHDWVDADCETPRTCRRCEVIEGEALGHDWVDADCETPKTCRRCELTDGEALGHDWEITDCESPARCRRCEETTEEPVGHDWADATCETPKTCRRCEATEGEALGHEYEEGECTRCGAADPDYRELPASGTCGERLTWLLVEDGTLTISGTGDMFNYSSAEPAPWFDYADLIRTVVVEETADSIGDYAFCDLDSLTAVIIASGVTEIGGHAMSGCDSLASVSIPATVSTMGESVFRNSSLLTTAGPAGGDCEITFGWTRSIPANAFAEHAHLRSVALPDSITTIGSKAFMMCSALTQVELPRNLESVSSQAFDQAGLTSLVIPDRVISIGSSAFESCPLTDVTFGDALDSIGFGAFRYCDALTEAVLPDSLQEIGSSAFEGCTALETVQLHRGLATIGGSAFYGCAALKQITIPSTVILVGVYAFSDCSALTQITFQGSAPRIGSRAFNNVTATAYYPGSDASWTDSVRKDYGGSITWVPVSDPEEVIRLAGSNRYETAFAVADQLKEELGVDRFSAVVVAYGQNFPDALTGSYLASVKNAPILLTEPAMDARAILYIKDNLVPGGKVYILGGSAAVSDVFETAARFMGYSVERLKGAGRYETNLSILQAAGVNTTDEVLIATGTNYADSLSASATGLPMLLVGDHLTDEQRIFLLNTSRRFVIIGGTSAVSEEVEAELGTLGTVVRIKGANRCGTSVEIAKRYFTNPESVVLAYANGFPDGLCGGPLALSLGAPLILAGNEAWQTADEYVEGISTGVVTGGTSRISDETVREIFDLDPDTPINRG